MKKIVFIFFSLLFSSGFVLLAQDKRIFLGFDADSAYHIGYVKKERDSASVFYSFLKYKTFKHDLIETHSFEETNRAGIILDAKSTTTETIKAVAEFGTEALKCKTEYTIELTFITKGRSALTSVNNLFAKDENKSPQDGPYTFAKYMEATGKIMLNDKTYDFFYSLAWKDKLKPKGWVKYDGDSLLITAVPQLIKKNKAVKNVNAMIPTAGIQLSKGDLVYAALDIIEPYKTIYISKQLTEEEKLLSGAIFHIICSYSDYFFWIYQPEN